MQLFLSLEHLEVTVVINWSNFNIVVSQGIGRPEERERDGGRTCPRRNQNIHVYQLTLPSYTGVVCGAPKQLQSNIKDH